MKLKFYSRSFSLVLIIIFLQGCSLSLVEKTEMPYKQQVQNDMYSILTNEQNRELDNLSTDNEINRFIDDFWIEEGKDLKNEYTKRVEYANLHFPDQFGWGRSDRKRIYIKYGPPLYIERTNFADIPIDKLTKIKSMEIWYYGRPGNNSINTMFSEVSKGEMKFIFADMIGSGFYRIIESTEDPADIDSRMFQ